MARGENGLIIVAGAPTAVTNSVIAGLVEEGGKGEVLSELYGATAGVAGLLTGKILDLGAQKRKVIDGLRRTPGSVLSGAHRVLDVEECAAFIDVLREKEIGTLFVVGGVAAVGIANFFVAAAQNASYELSVLVIAASGDNEVDAGDHNVGYGSLARFAASVIRDAGRAAASGEEPILVVELGGKNNGFAAAASVLARDISNPAPHAILVPEAAVDLENLIDELRRATQKYGYAVVVTGEGAKSTDGAALDGDALAPILKERLGLDVRVDKPGSLSRVAQWAIARADSEEAYAIGEQALRLAGDGMTGFVITSGRDASSGERGDRGYRSIVVTTQLDGVSVEARTLKAEHLGAGGTQVSEEFTDWARPLVGGALPEYISLA